MTAARKRALARVAARPDSEIDLSEIPALTKSFWKNAVRNPFYRPVKQQLTVRLMRMLWLGYAIRAEAIKRA